MFNKMFIVFSILIYFSCNKEEIPSNYKVHINRNTIFGFSNKDLSFVFSDTLFLEYPTYRFILYSQKDSVLVELTYENRERKRERIDQKDFLDKEVKLLKSQYSVIQFIKHQSFKNNNIEWIYLSYNLKEIHENYYKTVLNENDIFTVRVNNLKHNKNNVPEWIDEWYKSFEISFFKNHQFDLEVNELRKPELVW